MDREELEKKLEVTEELLEELYKLQKMLKKGTGPMAGLVNTANRRSRIREKMW